MVLKKNFLLSVMYKLVIKKLTYKDGSEKFVAYYIKSEKIFRFFTIKTLYWVCRENTTDFNLPNDKFENNQYELRPFVNDEDDFIAVNVAHKFQTFDEAVEIANMTFSKHIADENKNEVLTIDTVERTS